MKAEPFCQLRWKPQISDGVRQTFTANLENLPEVDRAEYEGLLIHELVQRRITEISAAQLQLQSDRPHSTAIGCKLSNCSAS
jgi:hypothetical protein